MTTDFVIYITREALTTGILILAPILGAALIVGVAVGIFQAVTQIHEMTLSFVPKIGLVGLLIFLLMPWFLDLLIGFTQEIFNHIVAITQ